MERLGKKGVENPTRDKQNGEALWTPYAPDKINRDN